MLLITKISLPSIALSISALYQSCVVSCFLGSKIIINIKLKMLSNNSNDYLPICNGGVEVGVKMLFTIMSTTGIGQNGLLKLTFWRYRYYRDSNLQWHYLETLLSNFEMGKFEKLNISEVLTLMKFNVYISFVSTWFEKSSNSIRFINKAQQYLHYSLEVNTFNYFRHLLEYLLSHL